MERTRETPRRARALVVLVAALTLGSCGSGDGSAASVDSTLTTTPTVLEAPGE